MSTCFLIKCLSFLIIFHDIQLSLAFICSQRKNNVDVRPSLNSQTNINMNAIIRKDICIKLQATTNASYYPSMDDDHLKISNSRDLFTHVSILDSSLRKLTGQGVIERMNLTSDSLSINDIMESKDLIYDRICSNKRYVLISHDTNDDPIYNFGNKAALKAFVREWDDLLIFPSRESVVLQSKDEQLRIELMKKVTNDGYAENASGIRVRGDGKFIKLQNAVVWNCYDKDDIYIGQAALFDREACPIISSEDLEER